MAHTLMPIYYDNPHPYAHLQWPTPSYLYTWMTYTLMPIYYDNLHPYAHILDDPHPYAHL